MTTGNEEQREVRYQVIQCLNEIKLERHIVPELGLALVSKDGHHLEDRNHPRDTICGSNRSGFSLNLCQATLVGIYR